MELIKKYFYHLSDEKLQKIEKLGQLYKFWNEKINIISRKDIDNIYDKHLASSLALSKFKNFKDEATVMDVGTGGGLPGIPLAIVFPNVRFYLIDARSKKIKVVNQIVEDLEIKNVTAEHKRVEEVKENFDFITGRGVTNAESFRIMVSKRLNANNKKNCIYYWTGSDNIKEVKTKVQGIYKLENIFETEKYYQGKYIIKIKK